MKNKSIPFEKIYNHSKNVFGYWKIHKNQKQFLEQLSKKYNIQNPNEWGNITKKFVNNSIYYYLESIYFNNILIYKLLLLFLIIHLDHSKWRS